MSLLYKALKPLARKFIKKSSLHQEESYEKFKQDSSDVQKKFKFRLPKIKGLEFHDEILDGYHIIVGKKKGINSKRVIVYFPGGGSRRWQLPYKSSMKNYILQTGAELWIPLFPLLPDHDLMDESEFIVMFFKGCQKDLIRKIWYGQDFPEVRMYCFKQGVISRKNIRNFRCRQ